MTDKPTDPETGEIKCSICGNFTARYCAQLTCPGCHVAVTFEDCVGNTTPDEVAWEAQKKAALQTCAPALKVYEKKGDGYTCQYCGQTFPAAQWNDRGQVCPNVKCAQPYNALLEQDGEE